MTSAELRAILDQPTLRKGRPRGLAIGRFHPMPIMLRLLGAGRITADDIEWARGGGTDAP